MLLQSAVRISAVPPRCSPPAAIQPPSDAGLVLIALSLAAAANAFQYSLTSGKQGINSFLMREKGDNPFYKENFVAEKPRLPQFLANIRLPELPFVEVYGQETASSSSKGTTVGQRADVARLYRAMDAAIEREQYDEAAAVKEQIDRLLEADRDPGS